jgi:hypothetical protein
MKVMNIEKTVKKLKVKAQNLMQKGDVAAYIKTLMELNDAKKQLQPVRVKA